MDKIMRRLSCVVLLGVAAAGIAQTSPPPDRTATIRKAEQAMNAVDSRPGDDKLGCEQIGAELAALFGQAGPELDTLFVAAQTARAEVDRTQQTLAVRQATEGPALVARSLAEGALAATNPVAAAALARAAALQDQMMMARAASEGQRGNAALQATANASAGVIDRHADKIPRMNRLVQLYEAKGCAPPPGIEMDDED